MGHHGLVPRYVWLSIEREKPWGGSITLQPWRTFLKPNDNGNDPMTTTLSTPFCLPATIRLTNKDFPFSGFFPTTPSSNQRSRSITPTVERFIFLYGTLSLSNWLPLHHKKASDAAIIFTPDWRGIRLFMMI